MTAVLAGARPVDGRSELRRIVEGFARTAVPLDRDEDRNIPTPMGQDRVLTAKNFGDAFGETLTEVLDSNATGFQNAMAEVPQRILGRNGSLLSRFEVGSAIEVFEADAGNLPEPLLLEGVPLEAGRESPRDPDIQQRSVCGEEPVQNVRLDLASPRPVRLAEARSLLVALGAEVLADHLSDDVHAGAADQQGQVGRHDAGHWSLAIGQHDTPAQDPHVVDDLGDVGAGIRYGHVLPDVHGDDCSWSSYCTTRR